MNKLLPILLVLLGVAGCSVNPVTGDRDLIFSSPADDVKMGAAYYAPMLQSQGGEYDMDPALTEYVNAVGQKLAAVSDVDLPYEFTVLNNSVPNAWALPGGKIAINRGLLTELNSEAELAAVLGHEIVHAAARHSAQQMSRGQLLQGLVVATSIATSDESYGNLASVGAGVAAQLVSMRHGREAELESDKYGMRYMQAAGYDPQGAVTLQETFVRLSEGQNPDWLSGLFASHPPSEERVRENRKRVKNMPEGGIIGEDVYKAKLQKTLAVKPAYEAYAEGREALGKKDTDKALRLAEKALDIYPEEANFHALRGDVRLFNDQYDEAVSNYDRAIARRDSFFYYYLQRGLAANELKRTDAAVADLERSIELLPTKPAHYYLGMIKRDRGQRDGAVEHFRLVAQGDDDYAQAAKSELARLELSQNPANYVPLRCDVGSNGNLVVSVRNDAPVAIRDVQVQVQLTDSAGQVRHVNRRMGRRIEPGQVVQTDTGLGPYKGSTCPAQVTAARIAE